MTNLKVLGSWDRVSEDHRNRASHRVRRVIARRQDEVERVIVRLGESLGAGGLRAPECRVLLQRSDGQTLRANARGRTFEEAIDRAAERLDAVWSKSTEGAPDRLPALQPSGAAG